MLTIMSSVSYGDFLPPTPHSAVMDMGARIKAARQAAKLTQQALAAEVGVSRNAVSQWENGETYPTNDKLEKIAKKLGVTAYHLLGDNGDPTTLNRDHLKVAITAILTAQKSINKSYSADVIADAIIAFYQRAQASSEMAAPEQKALAMESLLVVQNPEQSASRD